MALVLCSLRVHLVVIIKIEVRKCTKQCVYGLNVQWKNRTIIVEDIFVAKTEFWTGLFLITCGFSLTQNYKRIKLVIEAIHYVFVIFWNTNCVPEQRLPAATFYGYFYDR